MRRRSTVGGALEMFSLPLPLPLPLPAITPMPAYTSKAFTRWRLPRLRLRISNLSLLLIYLPRKDERLSRPGWLIYSGRFTHISGHPSAAGRAQDRESSPVKDRRSTNCVTQRTRECGSGTSLTGVWGYCWF